MAGIILSIFNNCYLYYVIIYIREHITYINGTYMNKKILLHIIARDNTLLFHCSDLKILNKFNREILEEASDFPSHSFRINSSSQRKHIRPRR